MRGIFLKLMLITQKNCMNIFNTFSFLPERMKMGKVETIQLSCMIKKHVLYSRISKQALNRGLVPKIP